MVRADFTSAPAGTRRSDDAREAPGRSNRASDPGARIPGERPGDESRDRRGAREVHQGGGRGRGAGVGVARYGGAVGDEAGE